ncbi:MAG: hypothetical protein HY982_00265 [Candidatus Magasanikbacteria bacterium]|nr:hypothetical protein [Candidatus Magasanikbacteria bacterium]
MKQKKIISDGRVQRFLERRFACAKLMATFTTLQCIESYTFASARCLRVQDEPSLGNPLCADCSIGRANREYIAKKILPRSFAQNSPRKKPPKRKLPPPS